MLVSETGGLEMGWLGTKEAVKKSSNVSIGEVRSSALAGKFAHIYAKLKTEEGQKVRRPISHRVPVPWGLSLNLCARLQAV